MTKVKCDKHGNQKTKYLGNHRYVCRECYKEKLVAYLEEELKDLIGEEINAPKIKKILMKVLFKNKGLTDKLIDRILNDEM